MTKSPFSRRTRTRTTKVTTKVTTITTVDSTGEARKCRGRPRKIPETIPAPATEILKKTRGRPRKTPQKAPSPPKDLLSPQEKAQEPKEPEEPPPPYSSISSSSSNDPAPIIPAPPPPAAATASSSQQNPLQELHDIWGAVQAKTIGRIRYLYFLSHLHSQSKSYQKKALLPSNKRPAVMAHPYLVLTPQETAMYNGRRAMKVNDPEFKTWVFYRIFREDLEIRLHRVLRAVTGGKVNVAMAITGGVPSIRATQNQEGPETLVLEFTPDQAAHYLALDPREMVQAASYLRDSNEKDVVGFREPVADGGGDYEEPEDEFFKIPKRRRHGTRPRSPVQLWHEDSESETCTIEYAAKHLKADRFIRRPRMPGNPRAAKSALPRAAAEVMDVEELEGEPGGWEEGSF